MAATIHKSLFPHIIISAPSTISRPVNKPIISFPPLLFTTPPLHSSTSTRDFPTPRVALPVSVPNTIDAENLETEFSGHGVSFTQISDSCVLRMALENGSVANVLLPSGLITSYKAEMWHGGTVEILHTNVSEGEGGGGPVIQGGVSVAVDCEDDQGLSWSPTSWGLHQVKGCPQDFIEVELMSKNTEAKVEIKHTIILKQDCLQSEINIFNHNTSPLRMWGSVLGHLTVSTPDGTFAVGLERSDFVKLPPPPCLTHFGIIPPGFGTPKSRNPAGILEVFSRWNIRNGGAAESDDETEGEEEDNLKCLTDEMSKVYTNTPRSFTILDRGRRNSVVVGREGFKEVYMFSPGSTHEWYGKYAYICIGAAALLKPIVVESQSEWIGVHCLHNPNL